MSLLLTAAVGLAAAQAPPPTAPQGPQVAVIVTEHQMSAEMVNVTMLKPDYPAPLLQLQIEKLGALLQSEPRGVSVTRTGEGRMAFVRASFAVDGLIDRTRGALRLEPIVRAFAGAPAPYTISSLLVTFAGETATARTLQTLKTSAVAVDAAQSDSPRGVEYRVQVLTQDGDQIRIPDLVEEARPAGAQTVPAPGTPIAAVIALIAVAALAAGALVYFAVLRAPRRA